MNGIESGKIHIAVVHRVDGLFGDRHFIKHLDVMYFGGRHSHKRWDDAAQINERMHLDRFLGRAKLGPRKQGEVEVNGRRVKGEQWLPQLDRQGLIPVQPLCHADQDLAEIVKHAPVPALVCVGKSGAGNGTT